jgi:hypothetical protein
MENTLLFGNGFNRLNNVGVSWEDILKDLKNDKFDNGNLPYTMIYEKALIDNSTIIENTFMNYEYGVKQNLAELMSKMVPSDMYKDVVSLNLKNYLTTNYDYCLHKTILNNTQLTLDNISTEGVYSIRRKTSIIDTKKKEVSSIWNIHGEIDKPISIMLGYDHYTGALSKLESYIKGNYSFTQDKNEVRPLKMRTKLINGDFDNYSWIEKFFNTDIHIIGLKLDYSETDIYWILNKRQRLYKELGNENFIKNKITFYTNEDNQSKISLLESFGVNVIFKNIDHKEIYKYALDGIK